MKMARQDEVAKILRACSKDEAAYRRLIELFDKQAAIQDERVRAAVKASEKRFKVVASSAPGIVYQFSVDAQGIWGFPFVGRGIEIYYGFSADAIMQDASILFNAVHPDDKDALAAKIDESKQNLTLYELEHRILTPTGEVRWVYARSTPERLANGDTLWTGIAIDITRFKHTEAMLRATQSAIQRLVQQIPIGLQVFNTQGLCTDVNEALLRIFAVKRENIVGKYNIFKDALAARMGTQQAAYDALEGKTVHLGDLEFDFSRGDARYTSVTQPPRTVNVSIVPIFDEDERVSSFVGVNTDITERKQAEDALRRSQQQYQDLANSITDYFFALDKDLRYTFWNSASERFTGLKAENVLGRSLYDVFPEVRGTAIDQTYKDVLSQQQAQTLEFPYTINDAEHHYELRVYPSPQGISAINRDVTERHMAQQREFDLALERARVRMLTEFIQHAAHEFRTPLATINTGAYILYRSDDATKRASKLKQIQSSVKRITRLIDMLLLLVRLESQDTLVHELLDVNTVLRAICDNVRDRCHKAHHLICDISPDLPPILGDVEYLTDAFQQLLDNACRFTPPGGRIALSCRADGGWIRVEITDSGPGITPEAMPHIFKTFWRQDDAHTTPGFGLGLPVARKIIEKHGGTIDIENATGQGARVRVALPTA